MESIESLTEKRRIAKKNMPIMADMNEALEKEDRAEFMRLFSTLHFSADVALHVKRAFGADWIRESGMRTDRAEAVFGPDWLDRDVVKARSNSTTHAGSAGCAGAEAPQSTNPGAGPWE